MGFRFGQYSQEKINEGEWEEIADAEGEIGRFLIAKEGNSYQLEVSERLNKEVQRKYPNGAVPINVQRELVAKEWAEGVLRDWKDIDDVDESGKTVPVPYSVEKATQLLLNDTPLFNEVRRKARDQSRFLAERAEKQAKKPQDSSDGSPNSSAKAKAS